MKYLISILMLLLPYTLRANGDDAVKLLDKAVAQIKADGGVQMDFEYKVCDANGVSLFSEKGFLYIDNNTETKQNERFALHLEQLKIWCNGVVQWNYSAHTNEIYITDADSDEAQNLSPLHIMQLYKQGYNCLMKEKAAEVLVTLTPEDANVEFNEVTVHLAKNSLQPTRMVLDMGDNGTTEIIIKSYKGGCRFNDNQFECPLKQFADAEVVDMR